MTQKFTPEEIINLVSQEADELAEAARTCEPDEINSLKTEIEQWLTDLNETLPSPYLEQAQPSKAKVEAALAKLARKSPKQKQWKGAEIQTPEPVSPPPPPLPPSPPEQPKITKV